MTECSALAGLFSTVQGIIISGAPGGETLPGARGGGGIWLPREELRTEELFCLVNIRPSGGEKSK